MRTPLFLPLLLLTAPLCAQDTADPCEPLLAASASRPAWPGVVVDVPSGDSLVVQVRDLGRRRIRLAGLKAPEGNDLLARVARFHLSRMAMGLRVFVVLDEAWAPQARETVAVVEDFSEAQLSAGMGRYATEDQKLLGPYLDCRCREAQERAKRALAGIWRP